MLVSWPIPALFNGVSQQPPPQRSASQCEEAVNCWLTVVDGVGKRPPTEHVAQISATPLDGAAIHPINRDTHERYTVVVTDGAIQVFGEDGTAKTVTTPHGVGYLAVPAGKSAEETFALVTVADYTFVLNKSVVVDLDIVGADETNQPIDYWSLNRHSESGYPGQWQYVKNPVAGTDKGTVQTFQDLPDDALEGDTYHIKATAESGFAGYYVRRTEGVWIEVTKPGLRNALKATTLPHALVRMGDGNFVFAPFSWAPRRVGDTYTNPPPSFTGRTINEIFFWKNRLGMTVDENVTLSRAGDFGNFFRMTALDQLDDDVIDIAATETKVTKLLYAVPLDGETMLFADQVQFRMDSGQVLTPTSGSLKPVTQYTMDVDVEPKAMGSDVYFVAKAGKWARVMEYFVRDDTNSADAGDVTAHVPRYVPAPVREIITAPQFDAMFLPTRAEPSRLYHYNFYWANAEEKAQSAWGHWRFHPNDNILGGTSTDSTLTLVIQRETGVYLEKVDLSPTSVAPGLDFQVYLDRRHETAGTYYDQADVTTFDLDYAVPVDRRGDVRLVRGGDWSAGEGGLIDPSSYSWVTDSRVSVPGNQTEGPVFAGMAYKQTFTFSPFVKKDRNGDADLTARMQLRTLTVYYSRAGFFATEVAPYGYDPEVQPVVPSKLAEFTGKTLGNAELLVGEPTFDEGSYSFQVYGNTDEAVVSITNDSHLGAFFTSAEVEAFWQKRARYA